MTSLEHTNDIDLAAIVEPAPKRTSTVTAPAVHKTPCRCCPTVIEHLGDLVVSLCDGCLDVLGGEAEAYVPRRRVVKDLDNDEAWTPSVTTVEHDPVDIDDIVVRPSKKLRDEIFSSATAQAEQDSAATPATAPDVDAKVLCATCVNMTSYRCGCGRLCCYECVDAEGRCPGCDGEEA